jgi:predicted regulator of Ras-like GTPase activity (Roadblock/LC7/MglB family)
VTHPTPPNDLTWMLDDLVTVPGIEYAVVLSADGLIIHKSTQLPQDTADLLAAGASSLHSITVGLGRQFNSGSVQQIIAEYDGHTLFVASAGHNARLAVLCRQDVDMGTVAYEMGRLVTRIGGYLSAEARTVG